MKNGRQGEKSLFSSAGLNDKGTGFDELVVFLSAAFISRLRVGGGSGGGGILRVRVSLTASA